MKFFRLTFLSACVVTLVMLALVLLYDDFQKEYHKSHYFDWGVLLSIGIMLVINYLVLDFLFNSYGKKQIRKFSEILPEEVHTQSETLVTLQEIETKISTFNQQKDSEIDMMKEMESYRKEYIGNISHELKTPLFSIQGYVETLKDGAIDDLEIRDKYVERIGRSVERLIDIVSDLDMINRYEAGEIMLNISEFDVNELIKETFDLLDLEAESKDAKLTLQTLQSQILVMADKQRISQVFINLIANAIYYSNRAEATVVVKTTVLKNKVMIEVMDNGMGIKPEVLPRIFERFFRADSSRNRRAGGSGLGLAIVKHIMEAHQESIKVESKYLEGAKFIFMLEKSKN